MSSKPSYRVDLNLGESCETCPKLVRGSTADKLTEWSCIYYHKFLGSTTDSFKHKTFPHRPAYCNIDGRVEKQAYRESHPASINKEQTE